MWAIVVKADEGGQDQEAASNPLETIDEGQQRQAAERYQETPDHEAPLGGYQQALGDRYSDISQDRPVVVSPSTPVEEHNPLETTGQAQERQQYERYQERQNTPDHSDPLGGYQQKLGD